MNRFLRGHRILQLERHFCADNGGYWAILIEYVDGDPLAEVPPASRRERKDFSEGMTEEEKLRFGYFKTIRKQLADQKSRHRDRSAVRLRRPDDGEADSCQANELSDTGSIQFCLSDDIISAIAAVCVTLCLAPCYL